MKLSNESGLLASLMGNQVAKAIPRYAAIENEIGKHVIPPIRFLPLNTKDVEISNPESNEDQYEIWKGTAPTPEDQQFFPFTFYSEDEKIQYLLPWEPIINIEGGNIIAKRNVAKGGQNQFGSIKERWATDDYHITITGALYGDRLLGKSDVTYPREDMERLRSYLLRRNAIRITCEPLQILGINKIVIESMSFPFTKGENVQAYEIKALSDSDYKLIYERKKGELEVGMPVGGLEDKG